jgi:hypothetical protein
MKATVKTGVLLLALCAWAPPAWADIAGPEPASDPESEGLCEPDKDEGDSCQTEEGEDGSCTDSYDTCYDSTKHLVVQCRVCEEDGCSLGPGPSNGTSRTAWVGMAALGLAVLLSRRTRRRRRPAG